MDPEVNVSPKQICDSSNAAAACIEAGKTIAQQHGRLIGDIPQYRPFLIMPGQPGKDGMGTTTLETAGIAQYRMQAPDSIRREATFSRPESFVAYTRQFAGADSTMRLYGDKIAFRITAILDDHRPGAPSFCDHTARLQCDFDESFRAWHERHDKPIGQAEFANFLEDHAEEIVSIAGADMLKIVTNLQATQTGKVVNQVRLDNGSVSLSMEHEVRGMVVGHTLTIPTEFSLRMPIFNGGGAADLLARFRYRIDGSRLVMWFTIHRLETTISAAFRGVCDEVGSALGGPVLMGFVHEDPHDHAN